MDLAELLLDPGPEVPPLPSRHGNATVLPTNSQDSLPDLTDFDVSRQDPAFKGFLQVDFLWSIQGQAK